MAEPWPRQVYRRRPAGTGALGRAPPRVEFPDRATRGDPAARGSQRLPAAAGGQGRGRPRPDPDLARLADPRRRRPGPPRPDGAGPRVARPRGRHRGLDPPAPRRPRRARGTRGGPPGVGRRALGGHLAVVRRRARPPGRRGRAWTSPAAPSRRPVGSASRRRRRGRSRAGRPGSRRPARRPRPGSATPTGSMPVVSITGTNGKSTVTRLITHILLRAGHHVGTTTSDGILVDERMVDAGRLDRPRRRGGDPAPVRRGRRGARDGARRPRPAGHGLRVQRGERLHQRLVGPPRPPGASTRCPSWRRSRRRSAA